MLETECLGMKCLTWADFEAILYKLVVLGMCSPFQHEITAIADVVEEHMADMLHVHSDLVGTACLQHAFHQCDVAETL